MIMIVIMSMYAKSSEEMFFFSIDVWTEPARKKKRKRKVQKHIKK